MLIFQVQVERCSNLNLHDMERPGICLPSRDTEHYKSGVKKQVLIRDFGL